MIAKMTRYDFILLSRETEGFLSSLQELGVVDITRSIKAIDEKSASMIADADALKKRIGWLTKKDYSKDPEYAQLLSDKASWEQEKEYRSHWGAFDPSSINKLSEAGITLHYYTVQAKKFDSSWASQWALEEISRNDSTVFFVIAGSTQDFPLTECAAPAGTEQQAADELARIAAALKGREAALGVIDINALKAQYSALTSDIDYYLASCATENCAENALTVVTGFAPSTEDSSLKAAFDSMDVFYTSGAASVEDNPPIKLKNNKFVSMFEVLTDMYGRPAYNGFDPTPYISIFFLLFFAMCMGDAGYGILLMIIGLLLKKVPSFAKLAPLVVTLGAGTFVVGFLFHTFFSIDISKWDCIPAALKGIMVPATVATYDGTMVLALVVGVIHICLALVVKTIYATKNQGFLNSLGVWGWTLLIVGGVAVGAFALAGVIDSALTKIIVIVLGCVSAVGIFLLNNLHRNPLLNIGSGLWEAYNTATGLLGDVLSYLRLYALGLAGSMLGFAFNDLAKMTLGDGGFGYVPFVIIVVIGHTLNIAMAALGAFVHPLRLNFLEFFKNSAYEGSGRNYHPLKKNN